MRPKPESPASRPLPPPARRLDNEQPQADGIVEQTERPANSFPRQIMHDEEVEVQITAGGEAETRKVSASEPVVTAWDQSAPASMERAVGSWSVSPSGQGVNAVQTGNLELPMETKNRLKELAATAYATTSSKGGGGGGEDSPAAAGDVASWQAALLKRDGGGNGGGDGTLSENYKMMAELLKQQQQERRGGGRRRSGKNADKLKDSGYKLPQIVIKQEPMGQSEGRGHLVRKRLMIAAGVGVTLALVALVRIAAMGDAPVPNVAPTVAPTYVVLPVPTPTPPLQRVRARCTGSMEPAITCLDLMVHSPSLGRMTSRWTRSSASRRAGGASPTG